MGSIGRSGQQASIYTLLYTTGLHFDGFFIRIRYFSTIMVNWNYGTEAALFISGLLVVYLVVVVVLVRRQITLVDDGEEGDEEEEAYLKDDLVLVTDKAGVTDTVCADTVVMETDEIFL